MSDELVLPGVVIPTGNAESAVGRLSDRLRQLYETSKETAEGVKQGAESFNKAWDAVLAFEGLQKAKEFYGEIISASERAEQAQLKLTAVFQATGGASAVTVGQVRQLSEELQKNTLFKSEEIENAASVLATYTSVQGEHFTQAIKLSADLASLMGGDVTSSARQLGRALEDPERGLMALRRAGIVFTESERDHIKALQSAGDLYGAQEVILQHLEQRVGSLAEKMHGGLLGAITDVGHAWEDVLASLGKSDSDIVIAAKDGLHGVATELSQIASHMDQILNGIASGTVQGSVGGLFGVIAGGIHGGLQGLRAPLPSQPTTAADMDREYARGAAARLTQRSEAESEAEAKATSKAQAAVDSYVDSIKQQIDGLRQVTKEQQDFNQALEAAHTAAQKRQVIGAFNRYGVASLGAQKFPSLTGDITDPGLRRDAQIDNDLQPSWMGGQGFSEAELSNAGGGRDDGGTLDQRLAQAQRQAQQFERQYSSQQQQMLRQQQEMWAKLAEGMSGSFARVFDSVLQGRVRSFQQFTRQILLDWSNMLGQMAARQGGAAIAKSLLGLVGGGSNFSSGDSAGLSSMGGDVGSAGDAVAAEFHSGGIVGDDGVGRAILSSIFSGAPRFHGGLAPDEFPAILQKGEGVFTEAQMAAMGGGGGDVHFHVSAIDGRSVADFFANNRHHIAAAIVDTVNHSRGVQFRMTRTP